MKLKNATIFLILVFAFLGVLSVFQQHKAYAASWCAVLARAYTSNCLAGQDYTNSALMNMNTSDSSDTLKAKFLDRMSYYLTSGQDFQRAGAKYIIQSMLDKKAYPDTYSPSVTNATLISHLTETINQSRVTMDADPNVYFEKNTAWDPAAQRVLQYPDTDTKTALKISYDPVGSEPRTVHQRIKLDCGNPLGDGIRIPVESKWNLEASSNRSQASAQAGQQVIFRHYIYNTSGYNADYKWQITYRIYNSSTGAEIGNGNVSSGSGHSGTMSGSESNVPPNNSKHPDPYGTTRGRDSFTIQGLSAGTRYCERIKYSNKPGDVGIDNYNYFSNEACVEIVGSGGGGPATGAASCTGFQIPVGGGTVGRWDGNLPGSAIPSGGTAWKTSLKPSGGWGQVVYLTVSDAQGNLVNNIGTFTDHGWSGTYTPRSPGVSIHIVKQAHVAYGLPDDGDDSTDDWAWMWYTYEDTTQNLTCYTATCQIESVTGPNGFVEAGQPMRIDVRISNPSNGTNYPLPEQLPGGEQLNAYYGGENPVGRQIELNDSEVVSIDATAPGTAETHTVTGVAAYYAHTYKLADCPNYNYNVYEKFTNQPSALMPPTNDPEDLPTVAYTTSYTKTSGPTVPVSVTSWLTEADVQNGFVPNTIDTQSSAGSFTWTRPGSDPQKPGVSYCAHITIDPAEGYATNGVYDSSKPHSSGSDDSNTCVVSTNMPYTHVAGGDVITGMGFGQAGTCSLPSGNTPTLRAYTRTTGTGAKGSGTQFAAIAMKGTEGFSSATLRNLTLPHSGPYASDGLTFSNTISPGLANDGLTVGANHAKLMGGDYGVSERCIMPDFYKDVMPAGAQPWSAASTIGQTDTTMSYKHANADGSTPSDIHLGPGVTTIGNGSNTAIYTYGDVYIDNDVKYQGASGGSWNSVKKIPSFVIVARNIYIAPGVKQLDGIYIAQGTGGASDGVINTCVTKLFSSCKNQLVVNGVFLARNVYLNRTYSSLRHSKSIDGESMIYGSSHSCNDSIDTNPGDQNAKDCAAEIFNISPEIYLSQPAMDLKDEGLYQTFTSLSPVL